MHYICKVQEATFLKSIKNKTWIDGVERAGDRERERERKREREKERERYACQARSA